MQEPQHILVTGTHRSGTTWIGRTLAQHPRVRYIQEPFSVKYPGHDMDLRLTQWFAHFESSDQQEEIRRAFDGLFHPGRVEFAWWRFRKSPRGMERIQKFFTDVLNPAPRQNVLMKDPIALLSADWLHETYDLKVICMIRNPFAFMGSVKKAGWDFDFEVLATQGPLMEGPLAPWAEPIQGACRGEGDFLDRACLIWNVLHHLIRDYQTRYPHWSFPRHEDVALDPLTGFQNLFDDIGLAMAPEVRQYIIEFTAEKNPETTASNQYSPRDSRKSLETWKSRLDQEEIERISESTRELARHFYGDWKGDLPL